VKSDYQLRLQLAGQEELPKDAVGLLLPLPPSTADQPQGKVRLSPQWSAQRLVARDSIQEALLASFPPSPRPRVDGRRAAAGWTYGGPSLPAAGTRVGAVPTLESIPGLSRRRPSRGNGRKLLLARSGCGSEKERHT
jgi:hypothetical protein